MTKGLTPKYVGGVQGEPGRGAGTWARSCRTVITAGPEDWQERAGVGTWKKGEFHRAAVLHEAASPQHMPGLQVCRRQLRSTVLRHF